MLSNPAGETVAGSNYSYTPFGDLAPDSGGTANATSYRFTGQYADADLGLQYHRARWLNTSRASWKSQDPVWDFPGNFGNGYGYAGQNPIRNYDSSGRFTALEANIASSISGLLNSFKLDSGNDALLEAIGSASFANGAGLGYDASALVHNAQFTGLLLFIFASPVVAAKVLVAGGRYALKSFDWIFSRAGRATVGANIKHAEKLTDPRYLSTFTDGRHVALQLENDLVLYRGGNSESAIGQYYSLDKPSSVEQMRKDKAVPPVWPDGRPAEIDRVYTVLVPRGTTIYVGPTASQGGIYVGGTQQVLIPDARTKGLVVLDIEPLN